MVHWARLIIQIQFWRKNTSGAIGQRSFFLGCDEYGARIGTVDNSFFIGYGVKVGINTNQFDSSDPLETMVIGGRINAKNGYEGNGSLLTGEMPTKYMRVPIGGTNQFIQPSKQIKPYSFTFQPLMVTFQKTQ